MYRHAPVPIRQVLQKTVVRQTVRQTVVHLHQTAVHRHVRQTFLSVNDLRQAAFLLVMPSPRPPAREEGTADPSRPTRTAHRLLRVFSQESARRELRPFYSGVVRTVLREEQERYRSRPTQAISLIWTLFGRREAFRTLTRFYMSAVERLGSHYYPALNGPNALYLAAGVLLHSRTYRQYVRQFWRQEALSLPARYAGRERAVPEDLAVLPAARRLLSPRELTEEVASQERRSPAVREVPAAPSGPPVRLSEAEFRALARGVAGLLGREARLEALRRGRE